MSAFLGPIHHWLFKKIKVVESRRNRFLQALKEKYGEDFAGQAEELEKDYGPMLEGQSLEDLVGDKPIHGMMQSLVHKVETGEGKLVAAAIDKYNGDAFNLFIEEADKYGKEVGAEAAREKDLSGVTPEEIYKVLDNYLLEGLPCDNTVTLVPKSEKSLMFQHNGCLHRKNWESAGAPIMEMCCFTNAWVGGFIQALRPGMEYEMSASIASGESGCLAEIKTG